MNAATLRTLADLIDQGHPADYVGVGDSVTIIVSNPVSAARWRTTLDERTDLPGADLRLLRPIVVSACMKRHGDRILNEILASEEREIERRRVAGVQSGFDAGWHGGGR